MSVSLYISEFKESVDAQIQKNIERAKENPYPLDELNEIKASDPESAIAKMFDENGQTVNPLIASQLAGDASSQNKDLYERLRKGSKAMQRLKTNDELAKLDPQEELRKEYLTFKNAINRSASLGSDINVKKVIELDEDGFEDIAFSLTDGGSGRVNVNVLQSAFRELYETEIESISDENTTESSPLNDDAIESSNNDEGVPINPSDIESVESIEDESNVVSQEPEVTGAVIPADVSEQEDNFSEIEAPSPINPPATEDTFDLNNDDNVSLNEYNQTINDVINNINENVTNEVQNISNQTEVAKEKLKKTEEEYLNSNDQGSINPKEDSFYEDIKILSNPSEVLNQMTLNENTTLENNEFNDNSEITSESSAINSTGDSISKTKESSVDLYRNQIEEMNQVVAFMDSQMGRTNPEMSESVTNENIEVTKSEFGLDKSQAPLNIPKPEVKSETSSSESITVNETTTGSNESTNNETKNETSSSTSVSNSETNNDNSRNISAPSIDITELAIRLRKIENLLSGPLEVKVIE